jgi:diguanylate cyclase (GGDEF)-like protein
MSILSQRQPYANTLQSAAASERVKLGIGLSVLLKLSNSQECQTAQQIFEELLSCNQKSALSNPLAQADYVLKQTRCQSAFQFDLSEQLPEAVNQIYRALAQALGTHHCVLLIADEQTGLYALLEDLQTPGAKIHELTGPQDVALRNRLPEPMIQTCFPLENGQTGLLAVSASRDTARQQALLDRICPALATKVNRLLRFRQSQSLPFVQGVVLELASRLVTAVDRDAIITATLEIFTRRLGFDACQYVGFNPENGQGEVLFDMRHQDGKVRLHSYSHAGLQGKRRKIKEFSNLVGLLSSMARNRFYLHLNGQKLGERSLGDIFGVKHVQSALLLPMVDLATGEIQGTFNLFYTSEALIGEESRQVAQEAVRLASQAISRALVLEKALAMASSDELTGLMNRRGYYQRFESELERARRNQTPLCVGLVDVDHFKRFNDTYGHLSGDLVLKALAELFMQKLRRSDVICRFGGEEFAILLPDTNLKSAVELMDRVRQTVENLSITGMNGEALKVTISVGVAEVNTLPKASLHRSEISETLALADEQLYEAKNHGRNRVCFARPGEASQHVSQAG